MFVRRSAVDSVSKSQEHTVPSDTFASQPDPDTPKISLMRARESFKRYGLLHDAHCWQALGEKP